jgi:general L-amino acid transport system substrate-binding protein
VISKEPMAALVRQDDARWRDIALWSFNARVAAEELGINQANVEAVRAGSQDQEVQRLLGVQGNFGEKLGLSNDWAYDIIRTVGSYEDMWNRHFAPLGVSRGLNRTWREGGLMSALPYR